MTDKDSPEAVAARANQEDPIVMYLIVRESLGMSIGKTAAQCAHASQMLQVQFNVLEMMVRVLREEDRPAESVKACKIFQEWLDGSFRKVVLKADDKEWEKVKNQIPAVERVVVIDAGLTEIASGSQTVIGLWPMRKSEVPKVIKKLQVLK